MQQVRAGVMRWTIAVCRRMTSGRFGVAEHVLSGNQKVDVVEFVAFGWVHTPSIAELWQLRKSYVFQIDITQELSGIGIGRIYG
jgi:hypothetical protein